MGGRLPVICAYDSNLSRLEDYIFSGECCSRFTIIFSTGENPEIRESILRQWIFLGLKLRSKKVGFTYW